MQAELILLTVAIEEATSRRLIKGSHKRVCIQVHIYVNIYNYIYTIYVFVVCDYVWRNPFSNLFELRRSLMISLSFFFWNIIIEKRKKKCFHHFNYLIFYIRVFSKSWFVFFFTWIINLHLCLLFTIRNMHEYVCARYVFFFFVYLRHDSAGSLAKIRKRYKNE